VPLPRGLPAVDLGLEETIRQRRSIREFSGQAMDLVELAKILELADGLTGIAKVEGIVHTLRASPSAGNLHPIEVYPILFTIRDQEPGVHHYNPLDHELERLRPGEYRQHIYESITRQEFVLTASVALALTAIFPRTKEKYGERGYRYTLLDAGHIAQNVYLAATAMGLGVVSVGGMVDDALNDLLLVDGVDEAVVYLIFLGKCKDGKGLGEGERLF
jgi:SagB-type dehydrogenase family enzyme